MNSKAAKDVLAERQRQINVKGWTPEHDDSHYSGQIESAAICYFQAMSVGSPMPDFWPWGSASWKPKNRRRNLVKSGALYMAEKERCNRASLHTQGSKNHRKAKRVIAEIERLDRAEKEGG